MFAFPSIREFGGAVVLESMAMGAVPIIVNYAGPSELVNGACAFRVELGTRDQIVDGFQRALGRAVANPGDLRRKREAGEARARGLFTWSAKARHVAEVYRWVLGERKTRPEFDMPATDQYAAAELAGACK